MHELDRMALKARARSLGLLGDTNLKNVSGELINGQNGERAIQEA
jgi:hypothetical protein